MDALIALIVLSTTVALALQAADTARRAARQATETRRAESAIRALLDVPASERGEHAGVIAGLDWREVVTDGPAGPVREVQICDRRVEVRSRATGRTYAGSTVEFCSHPPEAVGP